MKKNEIYYAFVAHHYINRAQFTSCYPPKAQCMLYFYTKVKEPVGNKFGCPILCP